MTTIKRFNGQENGVGGPIFVWLCNRCGQPLDSEDAICNSGIHVGPDGTGQGYAIKSTTLAERGGEPFLKI